MQCPSVVHIFWFSESQTGESQKNETNDLAKKELSKYIFDKKCL